MFKESFKYYKRKQPPPVFDDVVDFRKECSSRNKVQSVDELKSHGRRCKSEIVVITTHATKVRLFQLHYSTSIEFPMVKNVKPYRLDNRFPLLLHAVSEWKIFELINKPGLFFIVNPWTELGVKYWVSCCLSKMTERPNKLNIDNQGDLEAEESWWTKAQQLMNSDGGALLKKLRWATLGYHHNWDTKEYSEEHKSDFPDDLKTVCSYIAEIVGGWNDFDAQAAIINFYHSDSTLSGHRDHSELNMEAPLFSYSFGQSAIFLLGGESLEVKPDAIFIDNGDIMIMSGPSRLAYHGVPRILTSRCVFSNNFNLNSVGSSYDENPNMNNSEVSLENSSLFAEPFNKTLLTNILCDGEFWKPFCDYMKESRINLNVRQVLISDIIAS